jgi:hypothetical protein
MLKLKVSQCGSFGFYLSLARKLHYCRRVIVAVAAVLAMGWSAAPARADSVTATFSNVNPGEIVSIPVNGNMESGWAGIYNFTNSSGYLSGSFSGFCIDIAQDIISNQTATWAVAPLANAPVDGNQPTAMGTLRANLVAELWYNDYSLIGTSNSNAAAFQLAIWEIINETQINGNGTLALNIDSGTFYATDGDSATLTTTNTWLSQLNLNGTGPMASNIIALTSTAYQDYVVQMPPPAPGPLASAPAPASLILSLIGAAGILALAKRRTSFYRLA